MHAEFRQLLQYCLYSTFKNKVALPSEGLKIWGGKYYLNFIYSEKATKFCEIFPLLLTTVHTVKSKGKISPNFVTFSEYMNFNGMTILDPLNAYSDSSLVYTNNASKQGHKVSNSMKILLKKSRFSDNEVVCSNLAPISQALSRFSIFLRCR